MGLGPDLRWRNAILQLGRLFEEETFWARGRSHAELRLMLRGSEVAVSTWHGDRLVGFGRATSDGVCRAVLWDVVVAAPYKRQGVGRQLVERLLRAPKVAAVERVYLMTTNGRGFYLRLGFEETSSQHLMVKERSG